MHCSKKVFVIRLNDLNGLILGYKNSIFIFEALPCNGVYETMNCVDSLGNSVFHIDSSNGLDNAHFWHFRLGRINKKCITQIQKDGVLESFYLRPDDECESYLLGQMRK